MEHETMNDGKAEKLQNPTEDVVDGEVMDGDFEGDIENVATPPRLEDVLANTLQQRHTSVEYEGKTLHFREPLARTALYLQVVEGNLTDFASLIALRKQVIAACWVDADGNLIISNWEADWMDSYPWHFADLVYKHSRALVWTDEEE